jgi:hypothetical protein
VPLGKGGAQPPALMQAQWQVDSQSILRGRVVGNNWQMYQAALEHVDEARTTLGGGQGPVVFYGMAKPVRVPRTGSARQP